MYVLLMLVLVMMMSNMKVSEGSAFARHWCFLHLIVNQPVDSHIHVCMLDELTDHDGASVRTHTSHVVNPLMH